MGKNIKLAKAYIDYCDNPANAEKTFDDFFDFVEVPKDERSSYLVGCVLTQAKELIKSEIP